MTVCLNRTAAGTTCHLRLHHPGNCNFIAANNKCPHCHAVIHVGEMSEHINRQHNSLPKCNEYHPGNGLQCTKTGAHDTHANADPNGFKRVWTKLVDSQICGTADDHTFSSCVLGVGHDGQHRQGEHAWTVNPCGNVSPIPRYPSSRQPWEWVCYLEKGHLTPHCADVPGSKTDKFRWAVKPTPDTATTPQADRSPTIKQVDVVNHPPHYTSHPSGIECIDVVEHFNFCIGNATKYLWRAGLKGDALEDLRKARWYVDREIKRLENQAEK